MFSLIRSTNKSLPPTSLGFWGLRQCSMNHLRYHSASTISSDKPWMTSSADLPKTSDFVVIGGGIIGITIASSLKHRYKDSSVTLLEKESDVGKHASGRNSGVLHAGFYYSADSLKAKLTRQGNVFLHEYCKEKQIPINECGKLVVARNEEELEGIETLYQRGVKNGVPVEKVSEEEALELEPLVRTHQQALWSPTTASADPIAVTEHMARDAERTGVNIVTNRRYMGCDNNEKNSSTLRLRIGNLDSSEATIEAKHMINCAGLYADKVAHPFGFGLDYRIVPFKGLYLYCKGVNLQRLIYPVPKISQPFLGVHFTVAVDGKVKIGPTAIPAFWREQYGPSSTDPLFDRFSWNELAEILLTESSLFFKSDFNFRSLAFEEMRKYSKHFIQTTSLNTIANRDMMEHLGLKEPSASRI